MKYCDEYAALLDLYVDGELSPEETLQVHDHLESCPGCRAYVDGALAIRAAFPDAEDTEVPDGFAEGVMAAIRAAGPRPSKKRSPSGWAKVLVPLAACCAIVVLLQNGPFSGGGKASSTSAAPSAASDSASSQAAYDTAEAGVESAPMETADCGAAEEAAGNGAAPSTYSASAAEPKASTEPQEDLTAVPSEAVPAEEPAQPGVSHFSFASPALTLTAEEAGDLLASFTPVQETEAELCYQLTAQEFETLSASLRTDTAAADVRAAPADSDEETFLVVVLK